MKKLIKCLSVFIFVLCVFELSVVSGEDEDGDDVLVIGAPMERTEQDALYSTVQAFVGSWWNGSDLYPDPCGWTPIQVLLLLVCYYSIDLILVFYMCFGILDQICHVCFNEN